MSIEKARAALAAFGADHRICELAVSSATVALAAEAFGCEPARIAKTLSYKLSDGQVILIVTAGDSRVDNKLFKARFHCKAKMLTPQEAVEYVGHAVGGVCPFGVPDTVQVWLDVSMQRFGTVYPACGSSNSGIEVSCEELERFSRAAGWVDVCSGWDRGEAPVSA